MQQRQHAFFWKWIDGASVDLPGLTLAEALSMKLIEGAIRASILEALKLAVDQYESDE